MIFDLRGVLREVARHLVARDQLGQRRLGGPADLLGLPAPGVEAARGRGQQRARYVALQPDALASLPLTRRAAERLGYRNRRQQRHRVRVPRLGVQLVPVGEFDDLTQVHDRHLVADVPDHGQVVRDHHVGQAQLVLQVLEQVDDLRLDRHVEGAHRFVGHDQLGPQGQGPGDPDALPLAAGELVRVAVVVLGVEADEFEQFLHVAFDPAGHLDVLQPERGAYDPSDRVPGVERRVGVLEDHLDLAPQRAHLALTQVRDVVAVDHDLAAGRLVQPDQQAAGGGLPAA